MVATTLAAIGVVSATAAMEVADRDQEAGETVDNFVSFVTDQISFT